MIRCRSTGLCRFQLIGQKLRNGTTAKLRRPDGGVIPCVVAFHGRFLDQMPHDSSYAPGNEEEECTWDTQIALVAEIPSSQPPAFGSSQNSEPTIEGVELSIFDSELVNRFRAGSRRSYEHVSGVLNMRMQRVDVSWIAAVPLTSFSPS